jgi:spore maturation protein A
MRRMSVVWVSLLAASVLAAAVNGKMADLTAAIASSAQSAVTLSIGLIGVVALWLGLVRVAEAAGALRGIARVARPVLRRLFPEVPPEHPAMASIVMNVAANLLGLGNAATPFGVEAMRRLEDLNPHPGTATDAQALFCAINTASLQIIPATIVALRAGAGARDPADVIAPVVLASACSVSVAVVASKGLARWSRRGGSAVPGSASDGSGPERPT